MHHEKALFHPAASGHVAGRIAGLVGFALQVTLRTTVWCDCGLLPWIGTNFRLPVG